MCGAKGRSLTSLDRADIEPLWSWYFAPDNTGATYSSGRPESFITHKHLVVLRAQLGEPALLWLICCDLSKVASTALGQEESVLVAAILAQGNALQQHQLPHAPQY